MVICRDSALNGIQLPFDVVGSHSNDNNNNNIVSLSKVTISITDGTTTIEIVYDPSDSNSPLLNNSPILGDDKTQTEFTLNGEQYKLSVSQDEFEMEFPFEDNDSNTIYSKFSIKFVGNNDYTYNYIIMEVTDELSGYLCGLCGNL